MPACSIKGCNKEAYDFGSKISLCPLHVNEVEKILASIGKTTALPVKKVVKKVRPKPTVKVKPKPAPVKPKAPARPVLKEDREIEEVLTGYVGRRGQAIVETILDKYEVEKGLHPTKTARVITVMSSLAEKDPSLEVVGAGVDTMLRRKAQQQPQQPQTTQQEETTSQE